MLTILLALPVVLAAPPATAPSVAWSVEAVDLQRFSDAEVKVGALSPGDRVEVLIIDGPLARVRKEVTFGWVPLDKLSAEEPVDEVVPAEPVEVPDFELGKGPPKF